MKDEIKPIGLSLTSVAVPPGTGRLVAKYKVTFQNLKTGLVVSDEITVEVENGVTVLSMNVTGCLATDAQEGIAKLADWLEGFAFTLRAKNKPAMQFPIFQDR